MKQIIYVLVAVFMLTACSQSKEKKAEALIKKEMKKSLYKPETYVPVETKVDSAFAPMDSPEVFEMLFQLQESSQEISGLNSKLKSAMLSMSINSYPYYQSAYDKYKYEEAKQEYDKASASLKKQQEKMEDLYARITSFAQQNKGFIGYKVYHSYRADNNAGNTLVGYCMFYLDSKMEKVLYRLSEDDASKLTDAMKLFSEHMDEMNQEE